MTNQDSQEKRKKSLVARIRKIFFLGYQFLFFQRKNYEQILMNLLNPQRYKILYKEKNGGFVFNFDLEGRKENTEQKMLAFSKQNFEFTKNFLKENKPEPSSPRIHFSLKSQFCDIIGDTFVSIKK